jgi:hypothetical protein
MQDPAKASEAEAMIADTACVNRGVFAMRNNNDFEPFKAEVFNPFVDSRKEVN